MNNILSILESETNGKCYTSYRYCADDELKVPTLDFDSKEKEISLMINEFGETDTNLKSSKNLKHLADKIINSEPLFHFFLDGSRKTYKIDDIEINKNIYPVMAGQIGVGCCQRINPHKFKKSDFVFTLVLSLPNSAHPGGSNTKLFFNSLANKINRSRRISGANFSFSKVLSYESKKQDDGKKYENLGIATIQDEMIDNEKKIVSNLSTKNLINPTKYLIKDGSLQYAPAKSPDFKELTKYKNHYKCVVGVSKMFNPELCKDRNDKSNADKLANLPLYHRTPAFKYKSTNIDNVFFAIWYVRIRDAFRTFSPFSGIVKIEKILITDDEIENGLDTQEVDLITANIINERNPVCYGKDSRWANHLYPVYLTETYIKSQYLSDINFLNLF